MADATNTLTDIARALLAGGILSYRKKVAMLMRVNKDYSGEARTKGTTIDVPISTSMSVQNATYTSTAVDLNSTDVDLVQITLDQHKETRFHLTDKEDAEIDAGNFMLPGSMHESIKAHAENINSYLLDMYSQVYQFVGTAGTTPFGSDATVLSAARKALNNVDVPEDMRTHIMDTDADENAVNLGGFQDVDRSGSGDVLYKGEVGEKIGFLNLWDNQVKTHTLVSAGTEILDGAATAGSNTVDMDGFTTVPALGDIFTIAGDTQQYTVVSATVIATTASTITVEPAMAIAYSDGAAVTFIATHVANLAFYKDAFTFAQRPLKTSSRAPANIVSQTDPVTGLSMRLQIQRPNNVDVWVHDTLFGGKCTRPEAAVRVLG